jgi:DNA-binding NarL/FixJ family response regulator
MMQIGTCHGIRYKNAVYCLLCDLWLESGLRKFHKATKKTGKTASMAARSDEPVVLIIDNLPLRSLNLISILTHLDRSASRGRFRITLHTPDEVEQCIDPDANCEMLIYNIGSASIADRETSQRLKALTTRAPDVPLVIVSDSECRQEIISALNIGAQGFVYAGTEAKLALQAFSFIINDRPHHLTAMPPERSHAEQTSRTIKRNPAPFFELNEAESAAEDLRDEGPNSHSLTARQKAVLELLGCGQSNKAIGRLLGMREGTVKVHVRQIMRKFGVSNRTQVAIVCANEGNQKLAMADSEGSSLAASSI